MTIHLTPAQSQATAAALRTRLANMQGLHRRLQRATTPSQRLEAVALEIVNLKLALSALEAAMLAE